MAKPRKFKVGTVDVFVEFVCRYRNVNTYGIRVMGEAGRTELRLNDDKTVYECDVMWVGPVCLGDALCAIHQFEMAEAADFAEWCKQNPDIAANLSAA